MPAPHRCAASPAPLAFCRYGQGCDGGDVIDVVRYMTHYGLPDESCMVRARDTGVWICSGGGGWGRDAGAGAGCPDHQCCSAACRLLLAGGAACRASAWKQALDTSELQLDVRFYVYRLPRLPHPTCTAAVQRHRPHKVRQGRQQVPRRRLLHQLHAAQGADAAPHACRGLAGGSQPRPPEARWASVAAVLRAPALQPSAFRLPLPPPAPRRRARTRAGRCAAPSATTSPPTASWTTPRSWA